MPRYRFGLTAGLLALVCGFLCLRPAAATSIAARYAHTATLLPDRTILIVGGAIDAVGTPTTGVQLFQSANQGYGKTPLSVARASHTATLLPNGEVLVAGGVCTGSSYGCASNVAASVEVYNPIYDCWHAPLTTDSGSNNLTARHDHTATLLRTGANAGSVLLCGGIDRSGNVLASCDLYTPANPTASDSTNKPSGGFCGNSGSSLGQITSGAASLQQGRALHTATMLPDGRVFFAGGYNSNGTPNAYLNTTEIYDPTGNIFISAYPLGQGRAYHTATLMGDGKVFIAGGFDGYDVLDNTEVYDEPYPTTSSGCLRSTEIYDPAGNTMSYAGTMLVRQMMHAVSLQEDGQLVFWGGLGNFNSSYRTLSDKITGGSVTLNCSSLPCTITNATTGAGFYTLQPYQLFDYHSKLHNVTGVIANGWSSYASNPNSSNPASPVIVFTGGEIDFDDGTPATGGGLKADLAGSTVQCLPTNADSCGYVTRPLHVVKGTGKASFTVPVSVTVGPASINSGSLTFAVFPPLCASKSGDQHNLTGGSLNLSLSLTGLSQNLIGANLSNISLTLKNGQVDYYVGANKMYQFNIGYTAASGLNGGPVVLDPITNTGSVTLNGFAFTINENDGINVVTLSSSACTPPGGTPTSSISPTNNITGFSGSITQYGADRINVGPINSQYLTFTADYAVTVVKGMIFSDINQFMPGGASPMSWTIPSGGHWFGGQRFGHTMTLTSGGTPEFVGGKSCDPSKLDGDPASCPLIPVPLSTGSFTVIAENPFATLGNTLQAQHAHHTTTLLPSGKMLIAGGSNGPNIIATSEIFDPVAQAFTLTPGAMHAARDNHTATLLPNGRVLVAGGDSTSATSTGPIAGAEVFYPDTGLWLSSSAMNSARSNHTATLLPDGNVLVVGGSANGSYLKSAEVYYSTAQAWRPVGSMTNARDLHTATLLQDGRVLVVGGQNANGVLNSTEIYDPTTGAWTVGPPLPAAYVRQHTATLLTNGKVLIAGGNDGNWETGACWRFDPSGAGTWTQVRSLPVARQSHTATLLPNGNVAVIGGAQAVGHGGKPNASVEIYDPTTGLWSEWSGGLTVNGIQYSLPGERAYHTTTLANDGTLYVIGGYDGINYLNTALSHFHMAAAYDANSTGGQPSTRLSSVTATDLSPFDRGETLTAIGRNFLDVTEASGGGSASADSDQRHPIWILQSMDGSGGGSSQGNSGFILDLTTRIYQNSGVNSWAKIDSSITVQLPGVAMTQPPPIGSDSARLPYGWYSLRIGANDQLSPAYAVQAGPHLPSKPATIISPYAAGGSVGTNSLTFAWTAPAGLVPGVDFNGYNVYLATSQAWISTVAYNSTSFTLNNLPASSTQQIMVMPYNISGDYPVLTYSATAYTLPVEPKNVFLATGPGNTFFVQWSTADPVTGAPYDGQGTLYELSESLDNFSTILTTFNLTTDNFAPAVPLALSPNIKYYFRVRACNLHGSPFGDCSAYGQDRDTPANRYVSTTTLVAVYNVFGVAYATDTVKWYWTAAGGGALYNIFNATVAAPNNVIAVNVSTNSYAQVGLTQNTRSVIQVQASIGGSVGPLSNSATAYSLAATPVFTALSCPGNPGTGITTGSVVTQWNTHPGGPGPENNPTTYQVEYATGNWDRSGPNAGNWKPGIIPRSLSIIDADPTLVTESAVLEGFNPAVPVYIRARSLNSAGQSVDPTVNHNYAYTDEWIDLVSSSDPDGYSSTLQQAPTAFYVIPPTGPTSATLWWTTWPPDSARGGNPSTSFQVLQTTCVVNGTPDFARSSGPMCGIVPPGLDFPALSFSSNTALVTNLNTWVTYYFTLNVADPPHWENNQPNIREIIPIMAAPVLYYTNMPGVTPGSLAVNVSALYGGSISSATVGISAPPQQTQHVISFSAPGGAFPSDTVVTISTFDFHTDPRLVSCPGAQTTLCGGDPNLAFEITANPPLQPIAPLYFTVAYNGGEPQTNDNGVLQPLDPKQAVLLRFDPASCKCVPVRNPGSPDSLKVTGQLNHLSIFQVGTVAATTTPESMRLYPNPYYASRDGYLTIDGVPAESRVRIFTLRGEMVFDGSADSHGIFTWQGTNRGGRAVASGVYLVVVEGNGIKAIRKLALIR